MKEERKKRIIDAEAKGADEEETRECEGGEKEINKTGRLIRDSQLECDRIVLLRIVPLRWPSVCVRQMSGIIRSTPVRSSEERERFFFDFYKNTLFTYSSFYKPLLHYNIKYINKTVLM